MVAHSEPPSWLYQLRNFGTPLLIVASGLTYALIYSTRRMETLNFYRKRLSKLVFPAWLFIPVFYGFFFVAFHIARRPDPFHFTTILDTFAFSGIEGVWILKVYITLALITPLALKVEAGMRNTGAYFALLLLVYTAYEGLVAYAPSVVPPALHPLVFSNLLPAIPYTILFLYGLRLSRLTRAQVITASCLGLSVFGVMAYLKYTAAGMFVQTQEFKYPPTLYYLSYGFFALNVFYLSRNFLLGLVRTRIVLWLSSHSLWIYLWHILALYAWDFTLGPTHGDIIVSALKAAWLLAFGVSMTALQVKIASKSLLPSRAVYLRWIGSMLVPA